MHFVLLCKCTQRGKGDLAPEVCSVVIAVLVSATLLPAFTLIEQVQLHGGFTEPVYARKCVLVLWGIVGACTCACHVQKCERFEMSCIIVIMNVTLLTRF